MLKVYVVIKNIKRLHTAHTRQSNFAKKRVVGIFSSLYINIEKRLTSKKQFTFAVQIRFNWETQLKRKQLLID